jgi:hypothetical protein
MLDEKLETIKEENCDVAYLGTLLNLELPSPY